VVFSNEHCEGATVLREPNESIEQRDWRALLKTASWYNHHLQGRVPLIMLSEQVRIQLFGHSRNISIADFYPDKYTWVVIIIVYSERSTGRAVESRSEGHVAQRIHEPILERQCSASRVAWVAQGGYPGRRPRDAKQGRHCCQKRIRLYWIPRGNQLGIDMRQQMFVFDLSNMLSFSTNPYPS